MCTISVMYNYLFVYTCIKSYIFDVHLTCCAYESYPVDIFDAFWNHGVLASETASSMGAKSENKNSVDFNLVITGFVGIKRK